MFLRKSIGLFIALVAVAALLACSSANRDLLRAHQLQEHGDYAAALTIYRATLPHLPATDTRGRAAVLLEMGECLLQQGSLSDAFRAYQHAAELDPGNVTVHLRLGELFLAAGAVDRAKEQAQYVLQQSSGSADALTLLGGVWAASGNAPLAENAYRRVLAKEPGRVQVAIALADLYNRQNKVDDARQVLRASAAAAAKSAAPWLALGRVEEEAGNLSAAESAYRSGVQAENTPATSLRLAQFLERAARVADAEQVLREVDARHATMPTALPDFQMISGQPDSALQAYSTQLHRLASVASPDHKNLADEIKSERARLATRLIEADLESVTAKDDTAKKSSVERARAALQRYRADLDSASASVLEAEIALADNDIPGAQAAASLAVTQAPDSAPARYVLGAVKYRAGDPAGARSDWDTALDNDGSFTPARLALAQYALKSGDRNGAEDYIVAAVRDEPGNLRALNIFSRVLLAQNRLQAAALIAHRALAVGGASPEPHLVLGEIALRQSRLGESVIEFEQAVLLEPRSERAVEDLTRVYQQGRITRPMLARMEKVATADPPSATLLEIAGRLYQQRGWLQDAERCLNKALAVDPQRGTAASALAQTFAAAGKFSAAAASAARGDNHSAPLLEAIRAEDQDDVQSAIQNYEKAVRQGDHSGVAANNLAWLYAREGRELDRALQLVESARQQAPDNAAVLDTVGVVRLRRREYSQAIKALEAARDLATAQARKPAADMEAEKASAQLLSAIRHHLSEAYLRSGQPEAAALVARLQRER